jgi:hypothetical protein
MKSLEEVPFISANQLSFFCLQAQYAKAPLDLPAVLSHYPSIELPPSTSPVTRSSGRIGTPNRSTESAQGGPLSRDSSLSPTVSNSPLAGHTLTLALKALADFLTLKRPAVVSAVDPQRSSVRLAPLQQSPSGEEEGPEHQATLLDTALLQALLATESVKQAQQLVEGPNFCHVGTCEPLLLADGRFDELLSLYKSHGAHREALELLKRQVKEGLGFGHERLAEYLKQLGSRDTGLVLEYSRWLLEVRAGPLYLDVDEYNLRLSHLAIVLFFEFDQVVCCLYLWNGIIFFV